VLVHLSQNRHRCGQEDQENTSFLGEMGHRYLTLAAYCPA
jgi:hypothetical protein